MQRKTVSTAPEQETRFVFIKRYAEDSGKRLATLREKREPWSEKRPNSLV